MIDDEERFRVLCHYSHDDKVFVYQFTDEEVQMEVLLLPEVERIYFTLTDEELWEFLNPETLDNLKQDFIWFQPGVGKKHIMQCTCNHFLESGDNMDKLAKLAVKHAKRTGHTLNPRGN